MADEAKDKPKKNAADKALNKKEQLFVYEYVTDFNATKAAQRAGYSPENERAAAVQASRMLRKANILRAIEEFVATKAMGAEEVLHRLTRIARGTMQPFLTEGNKVNLHGEAAYADMDLVRSFQEGTSKVGAKLELHDKLKALELLGKANGALSNLKDSLINNIDVSKLTANQIRALASGEDLLDVLLNP